MEDHFPALYRSANDLSLKAQSHFFKVLFSHLLLLIAAAMLSVLNSPDWKAAVVQTVVLLGALGCSIYLAVERPDRTWYAARAVAESVKTLTWRYIARAEPFHGDDASARAEFCDKLAAISNQNRAVFQALTEFLIEVQITQWMNDKRAAPLAERIRHYKEARVEDQLAWYGRKARQNRSSARVAFGALILVNVLAIIFALTKIKYHTAPIWPTDALVTLGACILTWMQAKRFSDLASSYSLAAHEINLVREGIAKVADDDALSRYVGNAENAFSREHTQWIARKDL